MSATVRKILSARTARPRVEEMVTALVDAACFIGRADGRFSEAELEVYLDSLREVVSAAVGAEAVEVLANTPRLLDLARDARRRLIQQGRGAFLDALKPRFPGPFARDGLVLAHRIVLADGDVTQAEADAFAALAQALGLEVAEVAVLKELAKKPPPAPRDARGQVAALAARGWTVISDSAMDAAVQHAQPGGGTLGVELDAGESALHVEVAEGAASAHLVCRFGGGLPGLLAVLDSLKDSLTPAALDAKLPALKAVCEELFVERDGRFTRA